MRLLARLQILTTFSMAQCITASSSFAKTNPMLMTVMCLPVCYILVRVQHPGFRTIDKHQQRRVFPCRILKLYVL